MTNLDSLQRQIDELKEQNRAIIESLKKIGGNVGVSAAETAPRPSIEAMPAMVALDPEPVKPVKKNKDAHWEEKIGIKLFSRLGILALVIGIGFFIKYVNDNNLIGYAGRILIGVISGIALVIAGEFSARFKKFASWGKVLVGGGLAVMYFSIYAAYAFTDYRVALGMSQTMDIIFLVMVAGLAAFLSIRDNSQLIAAEAFFLGFLTCLLNRDFGSMVLVYDLILTVALVVTAAYKKWPLISIGGVLGTYISYSLWRADNGDANILAMSFLSIFFLVYVLQSLILSSRSKDDIDLEYRIVTANVINSLFFFVLGLLVSREWRGDWDVLFCSLFAVFHLIGAWTSWHLKKELTSHAYFYLGVSSLAIAIPLWFDKEMVTLAWSVVFLVMLVTGLRTKYRPLEYSAHMLAILILGKVLLVDVTLKGFSIDDIAGSTRLWAFIGSSAFFLAAYLFIAFNRHSLKEGLSKVTPYFYSIVPTMLLTISVIMETGDGNTNWTTIWLCALFLLVAFLPAFGERFKEFRWQGTVVGAALLFKVFAYDLFFLEFNPTRDLEKYHLVTYLISVGSLLLASIFWRLKSSDKLSKEAATAYQWLAAILAFFVIVLEFDGYSVSVAWAILALILIFTGFLIKDKDSRYQGIAVLFFTLCKVFIYDTSELETGYRMISYISLGGILLGASFLYNKYKDKIGS